VCVCVCVCVCVGGGAERACGCGRASSRARGFLHGLHAATARRRVCHTSATAATAAAAAAAAAASLLPLPLPLLPLLLLPLPHVCAPCSASLCPGVWQPAPVAASSVRRQQRGAVTRAVRCAQPAGGERVGVCCGCVAAVHGGGVQRCTRRAAALALQRACNNRILLCTSMTSVWPCRRTARLAETGRPTAAAVWVACARCVRVWALEHLERTGLAVAAQSHGVWPQARQLKSRRQHHCASRCAKGAGLRLY
jgi:hypothetical protein